MVENGQGATAVRGCAEELEVLVDPEVTANDGVAHIGGADLGDGPQRDDGRGATDLAYLGGGEAGEREQGDNQEARTRGLRHGEQVPGRGKRPMLGVLHPDRRCENVAKRLGVGPGGAVPREDDVLALVLLSRTVTSPVE